MAINPAALDGANQRATLFNPNLVWGIPFVPRWPNLAIDQTGCRRVSVREYPGLMAAPNGSNEVYIVITIVLVCWILGKVGERESGMIPRFAQSSNTNDHRRRLLILLLRLVLQLAQEIRKAETSQPPSRRCVPRRCTITGSMLEY